MSIIKKLSFFILSLFIFASCSNLSFEGHVSKPTGVVLLSIGTENIINKSDSAARAAFPKTQIPQDSTKTVSVVDSKGDAINCRVEAKSDNSYAITNVPYGVGFYIIVTVSDSCEVLYKGKTNLLELSIDEPVVDATISLKPLQTENGIGSVKLPLNNSVSGTYYYSYSLDGGPSSPKDSITSPTDLSITEVPSGPHILQVSFWKGTSPDDVLVYSFIETINVYDNLETNVWVESSSSPWLTQDSGIFKATLSSSLVNDFELTTVFVDSENDDTTESGTYYNPYKSLQTAIDKIVLHGNTTTEYTINLLSNITKETAAEGTLSNGNSYLRINASEKRKITIQGYDGIKTIDAAYKGRVLEIKESDVKGSIIKLKNLELKNGLLNANTAVAKHGGGIYNTAVLELDNVKVIDCSVVSPGSNSSGAVKGGGIYNAGTLTINSGVISGCKVTASYTNKQAWGGGIYNDSLKTCTLNSCIITGCIAEGNSGNDYSNKPRGAGIYNGGTLTLGNSSETGTPDVIIGTGTYVGTLYKTPNKCLNGNGGGVYNNGTLTMNPDCVIGTYNPGKCASVPQEADPDTCGNYITGGAGAGLYCNTSSTVQINGGYISYNCGNVSSGNNTGVGLYLNSNMTCSVSNVEISYNYSNKPVFGAGFYSSGNYSFNNIKVFGNQVKTGATRSGIGAHLTQGCSISGKTWFDSSNDIYLADGKIITVTTELTPKNQNDISQNITAHITMGGTPSGNVKVLAASDSSILSSSISKFILNNAGSWEITQNTATPTEGILKQVVYLAGSGSTILSAQNGTRNGTRQNPYTSLSEAIDAIQESGTIIYLDGQISSGTNVEIQSTGKDFVLSKLPGATTAKIIYTGDNGLFIKTAKSIELNDIEVDGSGKAACAFWGLNNGTQILLNNSRITNFNGSGTYSCSGVYLTAAASVALKGQSSIEATDTTYARIAVGLSTCNVYLQGTVNLGRSGYISLCEDSKLKFNGNLNALSQIIVRPASYDTSKVLLSAETGVSLPYYIVKAKNEFYEFTSAGKLAVKSVLPTITESNINDALLVIPDGTEIVISNSSSLLPILSAINSGTKKVKLKLTNNTYSQYTLQNSYFNNCKNITELDITIASGGINNGYSIFTNMTDLEVIKLRGSFTSIGGDTFTDCSKLKTVYIPSTITLISTNAFENCTSVTDVYTTGTAKPKTIGSQSNGPRFDSTVTWHYEQTY